MKKLIVFICMMFFIMGSAFAQKGIQAFGVHLGYGSEIESASIGVKYQYNITNNIRLEPSANYFFEKKGIDMFDFNANAHYLIPTENNIRLYPLAGLTFNRWDFGKVVNRLGLNMGAGAEFDVSDNLFVNMELKYQIVKDFDQAVFNVGLTYMF